MAHPAPPAHLVLASASPARLATLRAAGIEPRVVVSDVDEDAALAAAAHEAGRGLTVVEQVATLARAKARAVADRVRHAVGGGGGYGHGHAVGHGGGGASGGGASGGGASGGTSEPRTLVLGCDSLLELDGVAHGKPATAALAAERWRTMRGRSGVLHTGHHLVDVTRADPATDVSGAGQDCIPSAAGVSSTVVHFARIDDEEIAAYVATGEPLAVAGAFTIDGYASAFVSGVEGDHHGVVGLSVPLLRTLVRELGLSYPSLWQQPRV